MPSTVGMSRTAAEWEATVGEQVRDLRLRADRTQEDLARAADVSVSALRALERGQGSSLSTLVAVVRALGRSDWLDSLAPPPVESPLAKLAAVKGAAKGRRARARGKRAAGPPTAP